MNCNRKDICYHYPKHCELCQATSDVVNHYPCFQDKDIVGVVRCKDCKQAKELPSGLFRCKLHSVYTAFYDSVFNVKADDFCSYGERKE